MGPYYHCKKTGHLIADCPSPQANTSKKVHKKKKAIVAMWDDSKTEFEEEIDTAHVCFMANREETSKVNLKISLNDDDLTMDELAQVFEELQNQYEISIAQNKKLKKKNDLLKNKLDIIFKEKIELSICFEKTKRDFNDHKIICRAKSLTLVLVEKNFLILKNILIF